MSLRCSRARGLRGLGDVAEPQLGLAGDWLADQVTVVPDLEPVVPGGFSEGLTVVARGALLAADTVRAHSLVRPAHQNPLEVGQTALAEREVLVRAHGPGEADLSAFGHERGAALAAAEDASVLVVDEILDLEPDGLCIDHVAVPADVRALEDLGEGLCAILPFDEQDIAGHEDTVSKEDAQTLPDT